jgi:hypothetical protein
MRHLIYIFIKIVLSKIALIFNLVFFLYICSLFCSSLRTKRFYKNIIFKNVFQECKINDHFSSVSHSNTELIQVSHNVVIYIIGSVLSSLENLMVKKKISDINEFKV